MKVINKPIAFLIIIVAIAALSFFGYRQFVRDVPKGEPQELIPVTVKLLWVHQAQFAGMYVAKEKGFYQEVGLDVTFLEPDFSQDITTAEVEDGLVTFEVADPVTLIKEVSAGAKLKAIAVIYQISPYAFVSLKESGIRSPADFIGKRLGNVGGLEFGFIAYDTLFDRYNIDPRSVSVEATGFDSILDLVTHRIDVVDSYRTNEPYLLQEKGFEYNLILPEQHGFINYSDVLVTSEKMLIENPKVVRAFVTATLRGWEYAIQHPDEAVAITEPYVTAEEYLGIEHQRFIFEESIPLIKPTGGQSIGAMNFVRWQRMYNMMKSSGLLKNTFDVADIYTTEFLK